MISFETSVRIERPIAEVFAFVSDPTQFPLWNSAVQAVRRTSGETGEPGSIHSMERELRLAATERPRVFGRKPPSEFDIQLDSGVQTEDRVSTGGGQSVAVGERRRP